MTMITLFRQFLMLGVCSSALIHGADDIFAPQESAPLAVECKLAESVSAVIANLTAERNVFPAIDMIAKDVASASEALLTILRSDARQDPRRYCVAARLAGALRIEAAVPLLIERVDLHWRSTMHTTSRGEHDLYLVSMLGLFDASHVVQTVVDAMSNQRSEDWWRSIEALLGQTEERRQLTSKYLRLRHLIDKPDAALAQRLASLESYLVEAAAGKGR